MIKNIYKSYVTTIIGVLFLLSDLAYLFINNSPDKSVIVSIAIIGGVLLFSSDAQIKRVIAEATIILTATALIAILTALVDDDDEEMDTDQKVRHVILQ